MRLLQFELLEPRCLLSGIHYVDADTAGLNNGTSWTDAYTDLQSALAAANPGDEIWVAEGTYKPTGGSDRTVSFSLKTGVDIYGGFDGTENALSQRDWTTNVTVLSGDLNGDDATGGDNGENSYSVVSADTVTNTTLDGFTVSGGNANGSSVGYGGGGMYNYYSSPTITNVTMSGNSSAWQGGGMYNDHSSPTLTGVTFSGNSAGDGGGMFNRGGSPALTDVAFEGNWVTDGVGYGQGGGMRNESSSSPMLTNVAFSSNSAKYGGGMYSTSSSPTLTDVTFSSNSASK